MKEARMQAENWEEDGWMEVDCDDAVVLCEDDEDTPGREVSEAEQGTALDPRERTEQGDGEGMSAREVVKADHGTALYELEDDHLTNDETMPQAPEVAEPEHATLHAAPEDSHSSGEDQLAEYESKIRKHLHGGNKELARVGAYLCRAKESMDNDAKGADQEVLFTEWYQREFRLSPDRARRLMRWVRPVLDEVDWSNDDDPILSELAAIGPCVFDEIQKIDRSLWRFNEEGRLILSGTEMDLGDLPVRGLSFREIKAFREGLTSKKKQNGEDGQQSDENKNLPEEPKETDGHETDPAGDSNAEGDSADGSEGNPTGSPEATEDAKEELPESQNNKHECPPNTTEKEFVKLQEEAPDRWAYGERCQAKTTIICGKAHPKGEFAGAEVFGFNASIVFQDDQPVPSEKNGKDDAFLVLKSPGKAIIHWFDHETAHWRTCNIDIEKHEQ